MIPQSSNPKDRIGCTKVPLSLIPLSAQIHAALAHFDGSCKYGHYNWRHESVAASIYIDAALRHIHKWYHGESYDADSGIHHLGHALACLNIILDAASCGKLVDDRPKADDSPAMLDTFRSEVIRLLERHGKKIPSTPPITGGPGSMEPGLIHGINSWIDQACEDAIATNKTEERAVGSVEEANAEPRYSVPMEHNDEWGWSPDPEDYF